MKEKYNKYIFCGFCALFIGLGIGRFAYSPLIPSVVNDHWLRLFNANTIASCLFWGYFTSLIVTNRLLKRIDTVKILRINMLLIACSFLATSFYHAYLWFMVWFCVIGFNTGVIFLKAPTYILSFVNEKDKGRVSGIMFTGVGASIIFSGIASYFLLYLRLQTVWLIIGIIPILLLIITWNKWPTRKNIVDLNANQKSQNNNQKTKHQKNITLSIISYGLFRLGFLGVAVYLSEFIYHYYANSPQSILSLSWILFGVGIIVGSYFFGFLSHHIGIKSALIAALAFAFIATFLLAFRPLSWQVYILIFIAGMGGASPTALFCSLISIVSVQDKIYDNWKNVLLAGAVALALGATMYNKLLVYISYAELFYIAGFALLLSVVLAFFLTHMTKNKLM